MLWFHRLLCVLVFKTFKISSLLIIYYPLSLCCFMAEQSSLSVLCAVLCELDQMSAGAVWVYANIGSANILLQILLSLGSSLVDCKKQLCFWENILHFASHSCTCLFYWIWFKKTKLFSSFSEILVAISCGQSTPSEFWNTCFKETHFY